MTSTATARGKTRKSAVTSYQMYIDGKFVDAKSGKTFDVYDPSTEAVIAKVPAGGPEDVDRAVKAAHRAFYEDGWKGVSAQERGRVLFRLAERIRARRSELAELETVNSGKPIVESEYDMDDTATCYEYYGGLATKINGEVLPVPADAVAFAMREPIGVAGQIIPWNYPLLMAAWKIAPAIAAGCTVVIKPAEQTPLSLLKLAEDFEAVGLPPGVVNVITGDGPGAGAPLVAHRDVRKIAFTGSAEVGKLIMRSAADQLKRVSLELGGKSPNIFFSDADFENAVDGALFGTFINQGEVCSAGSRGGQGQDHPARPRHGPRDQDGPAGERRAARPGGGLPQDRPGRGQGGRGRRDAEAVRQGLVRRADDLLRRRQLGQDRPGRDLRSRDERHSVQGRGRRHPHRQHDAVRARGGGVDA